MMLYGTISKLVRNTSSKKTEPVCDMPVCSAECVSNPRERRGCLAGDVDRCDREFGTLPALLRRGDVSLSGDVCPKRRDYVCRVLRGLFDVDEVFVQFRAPNGEFDVGCSCLPVVKESKELIGTNETGGFEKPVQSQAREHK